VRPEFGVAEKAADHEPFLPRGKKHSHPSHSTRRGGGKRKGIGHGLVILAERETWLLSKGHLTSSREEKKGAAYVPKDGRDASFKAGREGASLRKPVKTPRRDRDRTRKASTVS